MGKKFTIVLVMLVVAIGISGGFVAGGLAAYSRFQQSSQETQEHCGGQAPVHICVQSPLAIFSAYYPFYLTTHAAQFIVTYSSDAAETLVMRVSIQGFSQVESHTVNADGTTQSQGFLPVASSSAVRALTSDVQTSLDVRVTDTKGDLYYSNDSQLLLYRHELMQWVASNRLKIAAWVTPDDPAVKMLVTQAAALLPGEPSPAPAAMIGYGTHPSARDVRDQVDAIFDALRVNYHIHYRQEAVPYNGPGDTSASLENINLPAETLQARSGMCIELTVLLASAVEQIGLRAEIVMVSGHAYLGVASLPDSTHMEYWDAVELNANVAGDSANVSTDQANMTNQILDTIVISDARAAGVEPMV